MARTISLPDIITELAELCNTPSDTAAEFLHALAQTIAEGLAEEGSVKLKNIGTFKIIEESDGNRIAFLAADSLSENVNAPFALFEAVELDDNITDEELSRAAVDSRVGETPVSETEILEVAEEMDSPEPHEESEDPEPQPETEPATPQPKSEPLEPKPAVMAASPGTQPAVHETPERLRQTPPPVPPVTPARPQRPVTSPQPPVTPPQQPITPPQPPVTPPQPPVTPPQPPVQIIMPSPTESEGDERRNRASHTTVWILVSVLALIIGLIVGYFGFPWINLNKVKNVRIEADNVSVTPRNDSKVKVTDMPSDTVASADTVSEAPEADTTVEPEAESAEVAEPAAPQVVTEVVDGSNYLSRIARRHYGRDIFWVYIYEENRNVISNPNNIRPGTVVTVPPAEKYGIDPNDKESIRRAEQKSAEIIRQSQPEGN